MEWFKTLTKNLYAYRYKLTYLAIAILVAVAFLYRLSTLTPGPHTVELEFLEVTKSVGINNFLENIIFLPYTLLSSLINGLLGVSQMSMRLTSVIFAASIMPMLYFVLYIWHTRRIATLGVLLLLSSSWFIGLARFGAPHIMYAWGAMAAITSMTLIFHHRRHSRMRLYILALAGLLLGLSLYVPYVGYIFLLTALIGHRYIRRLVDEISDLEKVVVSVLGGLVILPLIVGIFVTPDSGLALLGIQTDNFPNLAELLERMKDIFSHIFWQSDGSLITNVGSLPLLGIFGAALAALGMYHYEQHRHNLRTHVIVGVFFMMILVLALDFQVEKMALLLPIVYILIAMGAVTLLTQWYNIFPKNPFARTLGLVVIALFIVVSISYHNQRYFAAWARSPETKVAFSDDVILIDERANDYINNEKIDSISLYMDDPRLTRIQIWLEARLDVAILNSLSPDFENSQLLIVSDEYQDNHAPFLDTNIYEQDSKLETTSILKPSVYSFFLKKTAE